MNQRKHPAAVLALDFDGVICDSLEECLVSSYNAYQRLEGSDRWVETPEEIPPDVAGRFRRNRHYARNAPEFWIIIHWALRGRDDMDARRFDALVLEHAGRLTEFESAFFKARRDLSGADMERWLGLSRMYPAFRDGWQEVRERLPVHLVTTKDLVSVRIFNERWDLDIPDENLWTKEMGQPKPEIVRRVAELEGLSPHDMLFLDDHPHHVRAVAATGARSFWAAWGFLGARRPGPIDDEGTIFIRLTRMADLLPFLEASC